MNVNNVQDAFDDLWATVITDMSFDMVTKNRFRIDCKNGGTEEKHFVEFHEVSALYFFNDSTTLRKDFYDYDEDDEESYLELTSIDYIPDCKSKFESTDTYFQQYSSDVNVALDIWSNSIFIEAGKVIVNGVEYLL